MAGHVWCRSTSCCGKNLTIHKFNVLTLGNLLQISSFSRILSQEGTVQIYFTFLASQNYSSLVIFMHKSISLVFLGLYFYTYPSKNKRSKYVLMKLLWKGKLYSSIDLRLIDLESLIIFFINYYTEFS